MNALVPRTHAADSTALSLGLEVLSFHPHRRNTLIGFATVLSDGLKINDWVALPARPVLDDAGRLQLDARGKPRYVAIVEWVDRAVHNLFSERVIAQLRARYPGAFEAGDAP